MKFSEVIDLIKSSDDPHPLDYDIAIKYRGVGPIVIAKLVELGLVKPRINSGLSVRAENILSRMNITTKEQAKQKLLDRTLGWSGIRNYGWKTHREICAWAGVPCTENPSKSIKTCPHCGKPLAKMHNAH